jgi:hypothetical protein
MKSVSNVILTSMMLLATMLYSCDKEIETSPVKVDEAVTGTLTVYLYADLDQTNAGKESVPAGTNVLLSIPNKEITGFSSAIGNWEKTVAVDAQGKIEVTVPTNSTGVNVSIRPADFTFAQVQALTSTDATVTKLFSYDLATSYNVKAEEKVIRVLNYNKENTFSSYINYVTISGKAYAETDDNNSVTENAPLVDVIFTSTTGWSKKVTLVKTGAYTTFTVQVPASINGLSYPISYTYDFSADKNVADGAGWVKKLYRYNDTKSLGTFSANTDGQSLNFGIGTKVD